MTETRTSDRVLELSDEDTTDSIAVITTPDAPTLLGLAGSPTPTITTPPTIDLRSQASQAETLFDRFEALGFGDVVVVPRDTDVSPVHVDLRTTFARDIVLGCPIVVSSTVCNAATAIAVARSGGIAVLPGNMGIAQQVGAVQRVKHAHRGWIDAPVSLSHSHTVAEAGLVWLEHDISGAPVVDALNRVIGILTKRDVRFCTAVDANRSVRDFMTHLPHLVTAPVGTTLAEARRLMMTNRVEKLPMLNEHDQLVGLLTVRDLLAAEAFAHAAVDSPGQLRCAAMVGAAGTDLQERVAALAEVGVDAIVVAHADRSFAGIANAIAQIRMTWPNLAIVAGNVNTSEGVRALHGAGADAVVTGGPVAAGVGVPLLSRLHDTGEAARDLGLPLLATGVNTPGDVVKAMAVGASAVVIDPSVLGAGSNATANYAERMVNQVASGLRTGMAGAGASSISELHTTATMMRVTRSVE
jgi:IMP dehydrogenase